MKVGILGLGLMGTAIAERLTGHADLAGGHDSDPARCAAWTPRGGPVAPNPAALGRACDLVMIAVYDADQVEQVIFGPDGLARVAQPLDLLCITTCEPERIASLALRTRQAGHTLVESPISGTSEQLRQGEATGLVAGDPAARSRLAPVLDRLCRECLVFDRPGDAARAKLAINLVLQLNRAALAEGLVFAEALGLTPGALLAALRRSAAASAVMDSKGPRMISRDYAPQSRIAQTLKDADMILDAAADAGLSLTLFPAQRDLLAATIDRVGPDVDSAAIIEAVRDRRRAS